MSDSAKYKNSTRLIQLALISGTLIASSAWGFETNYDRGRVDFAGRVTDSFYQYAPTTSTGEVESHLVFNLTYD